MTPTTKHVEEAQRLTRCLALSLKYELPGSLALVPDELLYRVVAIELEKHIPLPTLLAAQEELKTLKEKHNVEHGAFVAMTEERDQLRAERDELRELNLKLRTHNAALLAVARAMRTVRTACAMRSEPYIPQDVRYEIEIIMDNALSALEPLGIIL